MSLKLTLIFWIVKMVDCNCRFIDIQTFMVILTNN